MSSGRWEHIQELYHAALELEPTRRSAFLEEACGDDEALCREVEALLAEHGKAGSFLETPALDLAAQVRAGQGSASVVGRQIGSYRILSLLGVGGMGEVYLAQDTRLERSLALKVLPTAWASDQDRMRRFVREAKAASALKHPNVAHIYDIGEWNGLQFIAMEYVEGQTLAAKISNHPLNLTEVVEIGIQVADALDEAHSKGITHRDIKPANLMLTARGQVKVLDFGLAKVTWAKGLAATSDLSTVVNTEAGVVMGTMEYMSPEQVLGKEVDHRTDVFSLGVVLYQMATGRLPFSGKSQNETLDHILHGQPEAIARFNYNVPVELERIVRKCLEKDRERRYQSARELLVDLRNLKSEPREGWSAEGSGPFPEDRAHATPVLPGPPGPNAQPPRKNWGKFLALAVLVLLLLGSFLFWWSLRRQTPLRELSLTRLTSDSGLTTDAVISPDGKLIAYASDRGGSNLDIWVRQVSGGDAIQLTRDPADDHQPAFSPDGSQIVFRSERAGGGIYLVSALGGREPRLLAQQGRNPRFSPTGDWIAYWVGILAGLPLGAQAGKIFLIPPTGGNPKPVDPPAILSAGCPIWSPDGTHLLFYGSDSIPLAVFSPTSDWWVWPLAGGNAVRTGAFPAFATQNISLALPNLVPAPAEWVDDRVFFSAKAGDSANLWQVSISPKNWRITGPAHRVTTGSGLEIRPSLAKTGRLVFSSLSENADIFSLPIDASLGQVMGPLEQLTRDLAADCSPSMSADGKKLAFVSERSGKPDIWMKDLESNQEKSLTESLADEITPTISPDGSLVAYSILGTEARRPDLMNSRFDIYVMPTKGGLLQKVCDGCRWGGVCAWSQDNQFLLKMDFREGPFAISLINLATGKASNYLQSSQLSLFNASLTHDGRWITFNAVDRQFSRLEVLTASIQRDIPSKESDWIRVVSDPHYNDKPCWSPDGNRIYFVSDRDGFACLWSQPVEPETKRPVGPPVPLYHIHQIRRSILNVGWARMNIAVAPDKIVLNLGEITGNIWMTQLPEN